MAPKASAHVVYDLKYHFVWTPKYRKDLLTGELAEVVREILQSVAEDLDMEIDTMEVMEDHVHVFLSALPRYARARVMQTMKSISTGEVFAQFAWLRRKLWGGEFWEDGYFVRSIGDRARSESIPRHIRYQKSPKYVQLELRGSLLYNLFKSPQEICPIYGATIKIESTIPA